MPQLFAQQFPHADPRVQMRREADEAQRLRQARNRAQRFSRFQRTGVPGFQGYDPQTGGFAQPGSPAALEQGAQPPGISAQFPRPIMPPPGLPPRTQPFDPFAQQPMGFAGAPMPQQPFGGYQSFARQRIPLTQRQQFA